MDRIRLLLADDHPVVRSGLCRELELVGRPSTRLGQTLVVAAEAGSIGDAVEKCKQVRPQVAILDAQLSDGSGIDACCEIVRCCPETAVVILTAFDWDIYLAQSWAAGAAGFVVKDVDTSALVQAVRQAARGNRLWTLRQLQRIQAWQQTVGKCLETLTPREREVLRLVVAGKRNREIAEAFALSQNTVEKHIGALLGKLNACSRQDLEALARRHYLEG